MEDHVLAEILDLSRRWKVVLSEEMARGIAGFFELLLLWNRRLNLTGAADIGDLVSEHLADSFAQSSLCQAGSDVVDVGSGGGLPAVPFAIMRPDCRVTLVEPRAKRVAFLHAAQREAEREPFRVVRGRAQEMKNVGFSIAVSRATFSPEEWLEVAPLLVRPRGAVLVFAARRLGARLGRGLLEREVGYQTCRGAGRWLGSYSVEPF